MSQTTTTALPPGPAHPLAGPEGDDPSLWEGDKMFNVYIRDYFKRRGYHRTADTLEAEAGLDPTQTPPIMSRQGLLFEWWSVFWTLFTAKTLDPNDSDASVFVHTQMARNPPGGRFPPLPFNSVHAQRFINGATPIRPVNGALPPPPPGTNGQQVNGFPPGVRPPGPPGAQPPAPGPPGAPRGQMYGAPSPSAVNGMPGGRMYAPAGSPSGGAPPGPSPRMRNTMPPPTGPHPRPPSRTDTPSRTAQSPSFGQQPPPGMARPPGMSQGPPPGMGPGPPMHGMPMPVQVLEAEFVRIPPHILPQLRAELGIDRDGPALTHDDKFKIYQHARMRMSKPPQNGIPGPSAPPPPPPLNGQLQPPPGMHPQAGQPQPPARNLKRNSTSPSEDNKGGPMGHSPPGKKAKRTPESQPAQPPPQGPPQGYPPQQMMNGPRPPPPQQAGVPPNMPPTATFPAGMMPMPNHSGLMMPVQGMPPGMYAQPPPPAGAPMAGPGPGPGPGGPIPGGQAYSADMNQYFKGKIGQSPSAAELAALSNGHPGGFGTPPGTSPHMGGGRAPQMAPPGGIKPGATMMPPPSPASMPKPPASAPPGPMKTAQSPALAHVPAPGTNPPTPAPGAAPSPAQILAGAAPASAPAAPVDFGAGGFGHDFMNVVAASMEDPNDFDIGLFASGRNESGDLFEQQFADWFGDSGGRMIAMPEDELGMK